MKGKLRTGRRPRSNIGKGILDEEGKSHLIITYSLLIIRKCYPTEIYLIIGHEITDIIT